MADFETPTGIGTKLRRLDSPDENYNHGQFFTRKGTLFFQTFAGDKFGWAVLAETAPGKIEKLPIHPPLSALEEQPLTEYDLRNFHQSRPWINDEEEVRANAAERFHVRFPNPFRSDGAVAFALLFSAPPRLAIQRDDGVQTRPILKENEPSESKGFDSIPGGKPLFAEIEALKRRKRILLLPSFEPEIPLISRARDLGFGIAELVEETIDFEANDRDTGIATEVRLAAYQTRLSTPPIQDSELLFKDFGEKGCFPTLAYATFASTFEEHVIGFDRPLVALNHPDGKPIFTKEGYCRACGQGPNTEGKFCKYCGRGKRQPDDPNPFPDVYSEDTHNYGARGLHAIVTPTLAFAPARLFKATGESDTHKANGVIHGVLNRTRALKS